MVRQLLAITVIGIALGSFGSALEAKANPEGELTTLENRSVGNDYRQFFPEVGSETLSYSGTVFEGFFQREEDWRLTEDLEAVFGDTLEQETIFEIDPQSEVDNKIKVQYELAN